MASHFGMMRLPPELNQQLRQQVYAMEEEQQMRYVTSFEQMAREEGRAETARETACNLLRLGILNAAQIAQVTGLTLEQVNALKKRGDASSADSD